MKIGVIADTHIPQRAAKIPQPILDAFSLADMVIHAGDFTDLATLQQLRSVCKDVRAVWGNMDPAEVKAEIPAKELINVGKFRIGVMHGLGHPDGLPGMMRKEFANDKVDVIIFGHAHRPMNEKQGGILFFNPGSATDDIFAPYRSYGILEINDTIEARIIKL